MPHDAPQPGRKCRRIGKARQRRPRRHKGLLHHVLGLLEIADQSQRRAEREVLKPPRQVHKGLDVATACQAHQMFVFHWHILARRIGLGLALVFRGEYVMYAASKGAVESLSIGLSREVAAEGIRVNVVEPGPTATGIHPPGRLERLTKMIPLARPGTPEEIAQAVMFLLSEQSSFTTGAVLRVAGGR
jgi:NAD(P)-dependent dehydrogenase (short-subunit alcohol dehydrogenase family)